MPQVFWATCPACKTRFTCEKEIWDQDAAMMCPSCLQHFRRKDSPRLDTVWPVTFADVKSMVDEARGSGPKKR